LTRQGIKSLSQSTNLAKDFANQDMILQIADINIFSEQDMKKNIKARLSLSDGNSRIVAMLPDKTHQALGFVPQKYDVIKV